MFELFSEEKAKIQQFLVGSFFDAIAKQWPVLKKVFWESQDCNNILTEQLY